MKNEMKFLSVFCALACASITAFAALEGAPVYKMTEKELLDVATSAKSAPDDRMTACQELAHRGTAASASALAPLLLDDGPTLQHAALYALQNIPGPEVDAVLKDAEAKLTGERRAAVAHVIASRAGKVFALEQYAGATEAITAFPPKTPAQKGDMSALPAIIDAAIGVGRDALQARFQLAGFPGKEVEAKLLEMARGTDMKKARVAVGALGDRRARSMFPQLLEIAKTTSDDRLRVETFKAFAQICDVRKDLPVLLDLLAKMPGEDRLAGALIRLGSQAFSLPQKKVKVIEAKFGNFESGRVADVKLMVDSLVEAGSREIMSGCRLVGRGGFHSDPAPGANKELRISYSLDGGPLCHKTVPENAMLALGEWTMDDDVAKMFVDACVKAKGPAREAYVNVLRGLVKRGAVPGSDAVLFRSIFNGRDLTGWAQEGDYFSVRDGVLVGESTSAKPLKSSRYLVYKAEQLGDFELRGEFRLSKSANSGIQLRSTDSMLKDTGYQADMSGNGGIVGYFYHTRQYLVGERGTDVALVVGGKKVNRFADGKELQKAYRPEQWNDIRIVAKGRLLVMWVNGVRMSSIADARLDYMPDSGYISIQLHQGPPMKIEFRNLRVRTDEVSLDNVLENSLLARLDELQKGEAPSFNGADWIWLKGGHKDGFKAKFRAELELPKGEIEKAALIFSCDDSAVFSVNGREVGSQVGSKLWYTPTAVIGVQETNLVPGRNVIEVAAANNLGRAAFIAMVEVKYADGRVVRFPSNIRGWKVSADGKNFVAPELVCPYGAQPYGKFK